MYDEDELPELTKDQFKDFTEHQLLEKAYEVFLVLLSSVREVRKEWRSVLRTKRLTTMLVGIVLIISVALQIQIMTRNKRLDELKRATNKQELNITKLQTTIDDLQTSVKKIEEVADEARQNPDAAARTAAALDQISRICERVEC